VAFIVQKFGGTSVANADARERMLAKVEAAKARGDRVVVVVSAMGRKGAPYATDTLLGLLDEARTGPGAAPSAAASSDTSCSDAAIRDLMASCGETISACLVAQLLSARGTKAVPLTAYSAGIHAEGPYGDAEITSVEAARIMAVVDAGSVPVVAGFQAVAPDGSIITIGRGGSDTSAVAIGAWAKADSRPADRAGRAVPAPARLPLHVPPGLQRRPRAPRPVGPARRTFRSQDTRPLHLRRRRRHPGQRRHYARRFTCRTGRSIEQDGQRCRGHGGVHGRQRSRRRGCRSCRSRQVRCGPGARQRCRRPDLCVHGGTGSGSRQGSLCIHMGFLKNKPT